MSTASDTAIAVLAFLVVVVVLGLLLPAVVVGALVSVIFGIGYWDAVLYVTGAVVALRLLRHTLVGR